MKTSAQQQHPWLVLRHVEHEHLGTVARALVQARQPYRYVDVFRGDPVPGDLAGCGGLIVMGGPMGVYESDKHPFLKDELRILREAAQAGYPVLGICLGAQLVASALGARVYPGQQKEIGWYPVEVTAPEDELTAALPARFMAFHWHSDTFDLPAGAVRLFRSDLYENQGFRWGSNVCAVQFHFEVTGKMVEEWLEDPGCRAELAAVPEVSAEMILRQTAEWGEGLEALSGMVFARFLARAFSHKDKESPR